MDPRPSYDIEAIRGGIPHCGSCMAGSGEARGEVGLRERGVLASSRGPAVRLAPHFHSTLQDVDTALDALQEVLDTETS